MSNQDYNRHYRSTENYDNNRRVRRETPARYDNRFDDRFDVDEGARVPQQRVQGYDPRPRQQYPQGYDGRPRQQYPQGYDGRPRRQYPQGYDSRPRQQYPQGYDDRQRRQYQQGYGDSYQYDNRARIRYDDRYRDYDDDYTYRRQKAPKKRGGGVLTGVRVIAVILLLVGVGIIGFKLFGYFMASYGHNKLKALSQDFDQLYSMNNDFFGWLKIDDTVVDYPVMYTPDEPERYLHTNFNGDYSESGELFLDGNCDPNGYHYLIYGHHMRNGSMFGSLPKYEDLDYMKEHRTFRFDTRDEQGEYEVFAVFYSQVYDEDEDVFKYYDHANLNDEATYNYYVENVKALSVYETDVTPTYGEKLVTLSTCNYHTNDGRFVVCARKVA